METTTEMPNGVTAQYSGNLLTVKGSAGELKRTIPDSITLKVDGGKVVLGSESKAMLYTYHSHLKNMVQGASKGYQMKLKIIYAHFPITIEVKGTDIMIKNFLGEKQARKARLFPPTKVQAKGQELSITGPDKEALGLTFASMRTATKIRKKDSRVFQDGFYILERS